jgi:hypothetical protein
MGGATVDDMSPTTGEFPKVNQVFGKNRKIVFCIMKRCATTQLFNQNRNLTEEIEKQGWLDGAACRRLLSGSSARPGKRVFFAGKWGHQQSIQAL